MSKEAAKDPEEVMSRLLNQAAKSRKGKEEGGGSKSKEDQNKSPAATPAVVKEKVKKTKKKLPMGEEFSKVEPSKNEKGIFIPSWKVRENNSALGSSRVSNDFVMNSMLERDVRYMRGLDRGILAHEAMHSAIGITWRSGIMSQYMLEGEDDIKKLGLKMSDVEKEKKTLANQVELLQEEYEANLKKKEELISSSNVEMETLRKQLSEMEVEKIKVQEQLEDAFTALKMASQKMFEMECRQEKMEKEKELESLRKEKEGARKERVDSTSSKQRKTGGGSSVSKNK